MTRKENKKNRQSAKKNKPGSSSLSNNLYEPLVDEKEDKTPPKPAALPQRPPQHINESEKKNDFEVEDLENDIYSPEHVIDFQDPEAPRHPAAPTSTTPQRIVYNGYLTPAILKLINNRQYSTARNTLNPDDHSPALSSLREALKQAALNNKSPAEFFNYYQPQLTDDEITAEVMGNIEETQEELDREAQTWAHHYLYATMLNMVNATRPLSGIWESKVLLVYAFLVASASASTSYAFGNSSVKFFEETSGNQFSDELHTALANLIFVPAALAQLTFSSIANIGVGRKFLRTSKGAFWEDFTHHLFDYACTFFIILCSCIPASIQAIDSYGDTLQAADATPFLIFLAILRSLSAFGTNGSFIINYHQKHRYAQPVILIEALRSAQANNRFLAQTAGRTLVKELCDRQIVKNNLRVVDMKVYDKLNTLRLASDLDEFCYQLISMIPAERLKKDVTSKSHIDQRDQSNFITGLSQYIQLLMQWYKTDCNWETFNKWLKTSSDNAQHWWHDKKAHEKWSDFGIAFSPYIGSYASLTNWRTASTIFKHVGWPIPADLIEFFPMLFLGTASGIASDWLGGVMIGLASIYANRLINSATSANFFNALINIARHGWQSEYGHSSLRAILTTVASVLYGISMAGSSYMYSFIQYPLIRFLNWGGNFFVFTGLGNMSINGAGKAISNYSYRLIRYAFYNCPYPLDYFDERIAANPKANNNIVRNCSEETNLKLESVIMDLCSVPEEHRDKFNTYVPLSKTHQYLHDTLQKPLPEHLGGEKETLTGDAAAHRVRENTTLEDIARSGVPSFFETTSSRPLASPNSSSPSVARSATYAPGDIALLYMMPPPANLQPNPGLRRHSLFYTPANSIRSAHAPANTPYLTPLQQQAGTGKIGHSALEPIAMDEFDLNDLGHDTWNPELGLQDDSDQDGEELTIELLENEQDPTQDSDQWTPLLGLRAVS